MNVLDSVFARVYGPMMSRVEQKRLAEHRRQLVLFEHVKTDGRLGTFQQVFNPVQKVVGRNCHLTRDIRSAVERAGFDTSTVVDMDFKPLPAPVRTVISGVATLSAT